jgi:alpha-tubulin suppressor-like RCC1 family protein
MKNHEISQPSFGRLWLGAIVVGLLVAACSSGSTVTPSSSLATLTSPVTATASAAALTSPVTATPIVALSAAAQTPGSSAPTATGKATAIAPGDGYTCAVTSAGGAKCWGNNILGMLGNGTNKLSQTPVDVAGLTSGVSAIAAGRAHACALTNAGGVKCWGTSLVSGSVTTSLTPVDVAGLTSGVSAIDVGAGFSCALTSGGGVKCWGDNSRGQLGNGSTTASSTTVDVTGLTSGVKAIATTEFFACALTSGGGVKCWGAVPGGIDGVGSSSTPVDVPGLTSGVTAIAPGTDHLCALTTGGGVKCLGDNIWGELGDGSMTTSLTPVDVAGLTSGVSAIASGNAFSCALTSGGGVKCWGANNYGELGTGSMSIGRSLTPVDVAGLASGVKAISVAISSGSADVCVVMSAGGAKCWGTNTFSQLGNGSTTDSSAPVDVAGL